MTAMLLAILRHLERHERPPCDILFLSTCDEELGGLGAQRMAADGLRCDGMIIGEPTNLLPIDRHKGATRFRLTIHGRAAHSAYPEQGANAIHAAAHFIRSLEDSVTERAGASNWPEPGPPTASVGVIHGGDQVNRVPDRAVLEIDFRIPPGLEPAVAERLIASAADSARTKIPGLTTQIETTQSYPAFRLDPKSPFRQKLTPFSPHFETARYATNAGFFARANLPCVVFGPGSPSEAHTADESISLADVEQGAALLERFLEGL
jgi:acetylornithine deacetylase/succinyl-diaminopimelate desuccinylase-like protein